MKRLAWISLCGLYRYKLVREWEESLPKATFIGVNPSTADAQKDDPTLRRMMAFAMAWGCGGLYVVNLFALRSPYPADVRNHASPIGGPETDKTIRETALKSQSTSAPVVACWGNHGAYLNRGEEVRRLLSDVGLSCFGLTATGYPRHPLYLPELTRLIDYKPLTRAPVSD